MKQTHEGQEEGGVGGNMSDFMKPKHLCGSCEPTLIHFRKQSPEGGGEGAGGAGIGAVCGCGSNANRSGVIIQSREGGEERESGLVWLSTGYVSPAAAAVSLARMQSN